MKGKNVFSAAEAERACDLLRQIRAADRDAQKLLRDRLREEVGFYISDFTSSNAGFTECDFRSLVERGTIQIG
ncbi:hypothetical protein [Trinickia sp. Y13]|uniref:hypothetical protein n=1 Tax=Trinickia sp. Y13 TaxID=2917807 RepID=UPI0024077058|nr:hypothetical protein [Trinickia sp. Y13]MDG0024952.1 hypothetical protein [Trinickia sp. Y13]